MKKQKLKLEEINAESLNSFELIREEELPMFLGGSGTGNLPPPTWDCVFNCFDYLDNGIMDGYSNGSQSYYQRTVNELGYDPSTQGGVYTSDIPTIGGYGGLTVTPLGSGGFGISPSSGLSNGKRVMMLMSGAGGNDHAVIIIGTNTNPSGEIQLLYFDPTTNREGAVGMGQYSQFFAIN